MGLFSKRQTPAHDRLEALQEEYQNYRRRTAAQLQSAQKQAAQQTAAAFLSVYDDLERALTCPCSDPAYGRGVEMILKNLLSVYAAQGIRPMDSKGKCFNPAYHEAVEHICDPRYRPDEIVEVLQTGFIMDDEVIRHAKVIVANCE